MPRKKKETSPPTEAQPKKTRKRKAKAAPEPVAFVEDKPVLIVWTDPADGKLSCKWKGKPGKWSKKFPDLPALMATIPEHGFYIVYTGEKNPDATWSAAPFRGS